MSERQMIVAGLCSFGPLCLIADPLIFSEVVFSWFGIGGMITPASYF